MIGSLLGKPPGFPGPFPRVSAPRSRQRPAQSLLRLRERIAELLRILAAGPSHRRASAAAPADLRRGGADHLDRVQPPLERAVEVGDQVHTPVLARAEHDRGRRTLLLDPVRFREQNLAVDPADPADVDVDAADPLLPARLEPHLTRLLAAPALLARALELAAQLVGLVCARVQQRVRLARGNRLDPPRP